MGDVDRIPKRIRDLVRKQHSNESLSFLAFQDWLMDKENEKQDWIIVARFQETEETGTCTNYRTFSVLASPVNEENLERILSSHTWEINRMGSISKFGKPLFLDNETYHPGWQTLLEKIEFQPIVFERSFHGYRPKTFELFQTFLLYHDAFFETEEKEYQRIDQNGDIQTIARIRLDDEKDMMIEVETHHLKEYLAANKAYLIRYHDHRRRAREEITEHIKDGALKIPIRDDTCTFELVLYEAKLVKNYKSASRLLGKDVVFPYPEPDRRHISLIVGDDRKEYERFIVGRGKQGEFIEATCNKDELGTPRYLSLVFFSRQVLDKYYEERSRYQVSDAYVGCLDIWGIEISINDENMVVAYLGDLGLIPYKEQKHWKLYNKPPRGGLPEDRIKRDFFNIVTETEDNIIYVLRRDFDLIQSSALEKLGGHLFKELDERDMYLIDTLHLPTKQEWKEFDSQVQALSKFTSDALNVTLLKKVTGLSIDRDGPIKGSIDLLEKFLEQKETPHDVKERIIVGFRVVQRLRSAGTAHRKDDEFDRLLMKYNLSNLSHYDKVKEIIKGVIQSLKLLLSVLSKL